MPTTADSTPVSMAMHLHASFSEGTASYEAHLAQAQRLGVDVLWWTDHDSRMRATGYRQAVRFDGPSEDEDGNSWKWRESAEGNIFGAAATFVETPHSPDEPGKALRLSASGVGETGGVFWYTGLADNRLYSTNLADTTVELDVFVEQAGPDAVLLIDLISSYHPTIGRRRAGQYRVRYQVGRSDTHRRYTEDVIGVVELPAPVRRWHRLRLSPVEDITKLWPEMVAEDNSLFLFQVGVWVRNGHRGQFVVDRLRFHRSERDGDAALETRRRVLKSYDGKFPAQRHYEAMEVSMVRHLNWFGSAAGLTFPRYGHPEPVRDWDVGSAMSMVDYLHDRGALVSYNHPMEGDVTDPSDLARLLISTNALGADMVEIGHRRNLEAMLRVWDSVARHGIFFTGTGVSDDHSGRNWIDQPTNFITSVWADSTEISDLLAALRSGRAWFVNPKGWRGELDILADGRPAMGGVITSTAKRVPIWVEASDLPQDAHLRIIVGPVDHGAPEPATEVTMIPARAVRRGGHAFDLVPRSGKYVRVEVRAGDGSAIGVSNPLWIVPTPTTAPSARRLLL